MAEFLQRNVSPLASVWQCVLCKETVTPPPAGAHYCLVENRIREIIRDEIDTHRRAVTVTGDSHG